jgi:hypothetical protein
MRASVARPSRPNEEDDNKSESSSSSFDKQQKFEAQAAKKRNL